MGASDSATRVSDGNSAVENLISKEVIATDPGRGPTAGRTEIMAIGTRGGRSRAMMMEGTIRGGDF